MIIGRRYRTVHNLWTTAFGTSPINLLAAIGGQLSPAEPRPTRRSEGAGLAASVDCLLSRARQFGTSSLVRLGRRRRRMLNTADGSVIPTAVVLLEVVAWVEPFGKLDAVHKRRLEGTRRPRQSSRGRILLSR